MITPPNSYRHLDMTRSGGPGKPILCVLKNSFGVEQSFSVQSLNFTDNRQNSWGVPADNRDFIISKQTKRIESLIRQARIMDAAFENLAKTLGVTEDLKQYCLERAEKAINAELKAESQSKAKA